MSHVLINTIIGTTSFIGGFLGLSLLFAMWHYIVDKVKGKRYVKERGEVAASLYWRDKEWDEAWEDGVESTLVLVVIGGGVAVFITVVVLIILAIMGIGHYD